MATKEVTFNQKGIEKLPNDKPVLYKIQTQSGGTNNPAFEAQHGRQQYLFIRSIWESDKAIDFFSKVKGNGN